MEPFAVQANRGCSTPCNLALALAAEFVPVRLARADRALDELTAWLVGARDGDPVDQLHALARLAGAHLEAVVLSTAIDDLLFNRVAPDGAGHPLLLAVACCHQVAARILNRIGERAERVGHLCWALRAAELRLALPFEAPTRDRLEADLRCIRARLN
jgi:hypothetical protein